MPKVPVTRRVLTQRIKRALRKQDFPGLLRRTPRGNYYVADEHSKQVVRQITDLAAFGRQLGVLEDYEEVSRLTK